MQEQLVMRKIEEVDHHAGESLQMKISHLVEM